MQESSGRHSESVYWRRRAIAIGGSAGALVLMVWALGALIGSAQPAPGARNTAEESALSPGAARSSAALASDTQASRQLPFGSFAPGASLIPASGAPYSALPDSAAAQSGAASGEPFSGAPHSGLPDRGRPLPECGRGDLRLDARVSKPDYAPGEQPRFQLAVTNTGPRDCYTDLSRDTRALTVTEAGRHVWSSSDCYFGHAGEEIHRLPRGTAIAYDITWQRRTSGPGCPVRRAVVAPGRYALTGRVGKLPGAPTLFVLRAH